MDSNALIARNVQRFRTERQMSLGELARRANLSKQTLSKIEQGVGNPTVDTVEAIAEALDVSLRRLVTEWGTRVYVVRSGEGSWSDRSTGNTKVLDQTYGSGYVRTSIAHLRDGDHRGSVHAPDSAGTLVHAYVISGRIRGGPVGEQIELDAGDFVQFPSDGPYVFEADGCDAVVHLVTTLPQLPQFGPMDGAPS